jgi:hypothetical protein
MSVSIYPSKSVDLFCYACVRLSRLSVKLCLCLNLRAVQRNAGGVKLILNYALYHLAFFEIDSM